MFPNKYGFWYILGFIVASFLNFWPIIGEFIGLVIMSAVITAIFHKKFNKKFRRGDIIDIGATCSATIFIASLLFFVLLYPQNLPSSLYYILIGGLFLRFIAVSGGIWAYNKIMKIK